MIPYYALFACALIGLAISQMPENRFRMPILLCYLAFMLIAMGLFAGLRSNHIDRDYGGYETWFSQVRGGWVDNDLSHKDPAFGLIATIAVVCGLQYVSVTVVYGFLAASAQIALSFLMNCQRYIPVYLYLVFCRFFVLLNITQIRAGVAIPLMSLGFYCLCTRRRMAGIVTYLGALIFHLSVAVAAPIFVLVLCGVRFQSRKWVIAFMPATVVGSVLLAPLVESLTNIYRLGEYLHGATEEDRLSIVSYHSILHVSVLAVVVIFFWAKLDLFERVAVIVSTWASFLYFVLLANAALAARLEEVLDLFWLYLVIIIVQKLPPRWTFAYVGMVSILGYGLFQSSLGLVNPYSLWDAPY